LLHGGWYLQFPTRAGMALQHAAEDAGWRDRRMDSSAAAEARLAAKALEESARTILSLKRQSVAIARICLAVASALRSGRKVLTAGNGGSASQAMHMAEEFIGRFRHNRRSLPAVSLAADPTALTCIANDFGFEQVFARQVEGLGRRGDVMVIFSTSGRSVNLMPAIEAARKKGVRTVCLLGKGGGPLAGKADYEIIVPGQATERIQEAHEVILHLILDAVERIYAGD